MTIVNSLCRRMAILLACTATLFLLGGCQALQANKTVKAETEAVVQQDVIQVIRYGRYTLVEVNPESQRDLMSQIIDVTIPFSQGNRDVAVGDAIRYVLQRSGYSLCDGVSFFDALPLPLAHSHLGPIKLKDALITLSGPAWTLHVDDAAREVCFFSLMQDRMPNEVHVSDNGEAVK